MLLFWGGKYPDYSVKPVVYMHELNTQSVLFFSRQRLSGKVCKVCLNCWNDIFCGATREGKDHYPPTLVEQQLGGITENQLLLSFFVFSLSCASSSKKRQLYWWDHAIMSYFTMSYFVCQHRLLSNSCPSQWQNTQWFQQEQIWSLEMMLSVEYIGRKASVCPPMWEILYMQVCVSYVVLHFAER